MTVKDLKLMLQQVPDTAIVVVFAPDHEFREACAEMTTGLLSNERRGRCAIFTEDFGEDKTPESVWGKRTTVILID